jgi:hypothetical protein
MVKDNAHLIQQMNAFGQFLVAGFIQNIILDHVFQGMKTSGAMRSLRSVRSKRYTPLASRSYTP